MTICQLGTEWKDPEKIPVDAIIEIWRGESKAGRQERHLHQDVARVQGGVIEGLPALALVRQRLRVGQRLCVGQRLRVRHQLLAGRRLLAGCGLLRRYARQCHMLG